MTRTPGPMRATAVELEARTRAIAKLDVLERPPAVEISSIFDVRVCFGCGCTDKAACWPPCSWIAADQCSACESKPRRLTTIGHALQLAAAENA